MKIGSLFSGIGGLDLAVGAALDGKMVWSVEQDAHCCEVLRRHFGGRIINEDVKHVEPGDLEPVDVLCGGWPCVNLSVAGDRTGLDGEKSRLYLECLRFAEALRPEWVVFENVPGVLKYRERIEGDLNSLGYGLAWVKIAASDIGAPHWRKRVFIIGKRGARNVGVISEYGKRPEGYWPTAVADGDRMAMYKQGGEPLGRAARWPTPTASDYRTPPRNPGKHGQKNEPTSGHALPATVVREGSRWPTPTAGDAKASGSRNTPQSKAHAGTSLTDASRNDGGVGRQGRESPGRLSADWVETLMGFPQGFTLPDGECQAMEADQLTVAPMWPMSRGDEQYPWEPPRLQKGSPVKGRPARLRALGNAVVPAQGYVAVLEGVTALETGEPVRYPVPRGGQMPLLC